MEMKFEEWLVQDSNNKHSSYCKACKVTLKNTNKSMLLKHKNSVKHKRSFEFTKRSVDTTQFLRKEASTESHQIAKSQIMFVAYFAEHNIPFANIDHLLDVCELAFPDSKIAKIDIDINQESDYKKSSDIYLGGKASAHSIKEPLDAETENRSKNNC